MRLKFDAGQDEDTGRPKTFVFGELKRILQAAEASGATFQTRVNATLDWESSGDGHGITEIVIST